MHQKLNDRLPTYSYTKKNEVYLKKRKISQNICENNDIIYATGGY